MAFIRDRLGLVAMSVAGGVWGALLARVLAELWPLSLNFGGLHRMWADSEVAGKSAWAMSAWDLSRVVSLRVGAPCWIWSPFLAIVLAACGALTVPLWLGVGRLLGGWATVARSWPLALGVVYLAQPAAAPLWGLGALVAGLGGVTWLSCRGRSACYAWQQSLNRLPRAEWLWDVLAFVLPLTLYITTLAPSVLPGDSGEFQFVAPTLGIPHPTGYPLYLVLGKFFSLLPIRSVAYRLNLLSAVAAAGAVWAVYRAGQAMGLRRAPSLVGAAVLAVSETFWSQATIAEKYALNALFVALTLWLGLHWRCSRMARDRLAYQSFAHGSSERWLAAWALCYGLSLTHHRTMLLLAPAFLWLLWSTDRTIFRWRSMLRLGLMVLAPLSLYLLLPLFSALEPAYAYVRVDSVSAFLDLVLARTYQSGLFQGGWNALPGRLVESGRLLIRQFGPIGLVIGIAGWAALLRRTQDVALRRAQDVAWVLLIGVVAQALFALNYYVPNTFVYYLPVYVWLAVCVAAAVDVVLVVIEGRGPRATWPARNVERPPSRIERAPIGMGRRVEAGVPLCQSDAPSSARTPLGWAHLALAWILVAGVWPMYLFAVRWPGMDQRRAYSHLAFDHTYGQMAARVVEPGALLVSDWLPATVLWYTQLVEGTLAPSAQVAAVDSLERQWPGLVEGALAASRPVYLARPLMVAGDRYPLTSAGPLVRVLDGPRTAPPPMSHPLGVDLEGKIRLLGCDLMATAPGPEGALYVPTDGVIEGGSTLHVTLYWQALHPPAGDCAVTVRWVDAAGHTWLERRNRHPVGGTYPTSRWRPGEVVADAYRLALPPYLYSGEYCLQATMGVPFAENGLRDGEGSDRISLATLQVRKPLRWPDPAMGTPVRKRFGKSLVLTGYEVPGEVGPGETASVLVQWLVCARSPLRRADLSAHPQLFLVQRGGTASVMVPLQSPLEDWKPGALVVEQYAFTVPHDLAYVELRGGEDSGQVRHRLPLRVASAPPPVANFGDLIRLRSYTYEATSLKPGDTVPLTLEWEAVRAMDEAYKVFVHVLGPNGLPIAQQDNEPVNGTYPTTRWQRGERVADPYAIALPVDLAPGEYPVEVGLYRVSDLSRLPVLDENQSMVDDKVFLTPLTVK